LREELRLGGDTPEILLAQSLRGATMRYIARDKDKLPTTDHAGEREPREPAAEFGHYAEKRVRPA
jgi:hypothetical protein